MAESKPKGIYSKGKGVSGFQEMPYDKTNQDKFDRFVEGVFDYAETPKDVSQAKSQISAAGRKFKIDKKIVATSLQQADKKLKEMTKGTQKGHSVTSVDRKTGKAK